MQNEANELGFSDSEQMYDYNEEDEPSDEKYNKIPRFVKWLFGAN